MESPHFRVFSDAGKRYANAFAVDMESFSRALPMFVSANLKENVSKLNVFALKDRSNLKILIDSKDTAGLFITDKVDNYAIANLKYYRFNWKKQNYARQILFHEYVHFYVANSTAIARTPVWHSEGLADFLSTILIDEDSIQYGHPHEVRLRSLNSARTVPIQKLFEATEYPENRREKSRFYDYAWLVYHFLFTHSDFAAKNSEYMQLLNAGSEARQAFEKSYGMTYEEFGKVVKSYFGDRFKVYVLSIDEPWDLGIKKAVKVPPSEISYELGQLMLARKSSDEDKSARYLDLGYSLIDYSIAHDPNNVCAHLDLWSRALEVEKDEGNGKFEDLGKEIKELSARFPKNSDVVRHLGDWLSAQVQVAMDELEYEDAGKFATQARGKYRKALALDVSNKEAYLAIADLYGQHGRFLLKSKLEQEEYETVLREAFYITSWRGYQYTLAKFLEYSGEKDEAIEEYLQLAAGGDVRLAKLANARLDALEE